MRVKCSLTLHNLLQALAGDSSKGESASEADEHEDAEAKAERLGRQLQRQQARAGQNKAPAAGASSGGAAAKQRKQKGLKRKVGFSKVAEQTQWLEGLAHQDIVALEPVAVSVTQPFTILMPAVWSAGPACMLSETSRQGPLCTATCPPDPPFTLWG